MSDGLLLIDTDVLIDYSRGIVGTKDLLLNLESEYALAISVVTQLELMVGCENKADFSSLKNFLATFEIIHVNKSISEKTAELFEKYRLSHGVMIPDMFIASTALVHRLPLLTKNRKDFRFIKELNLMEYSV